MIRPGDQPVAGYRVEKRLGSGQYGEVWRATSPGGTTVALKFLDMTGRAGWKEFRAIQRVKQIRHAHLMPIVAIWLLDDQGRVLSDDAVSNLAGENVDAARTLSAETLAEHQPPAQMVIATLLGDCSLRDRLNQSLDRREPGIPVEQLLIYLEEAAKGIDHLNAVRHDWGGGQVGVQHCDIKPDNILLTGGSAVVCDFGVAQVLADNQQDNRATSLSGSPAYMSPESFRAEPSATSDQYALAVTYYELRTGRLPIDEGNFAAAYEAHQAGRLDFSAASPAEQTVLRRATDPDPSARFPSASLFAAALREAVEGKPPRPTRPAPHWYAIGALAIVLAAGAGIWLAGQMIEKPVADGAVERIATTLAMNAPDVQLEVNGEPFVAGPDGQIEIEVPRNMPLVIEFAGNQERNPMRWTVPAEQVAEQSRHEFALSYTARFLAEQAETLLAAGDVRLATQAYAGAVEQSPDQYARLPEPQVATSAGLLWPACLQWTSAGDALVTGHKDGVVRRWAMSQEGIATEPIELNQHDEAVVGLAIVPEQVFSVDQAGSVRWSGADDSQQLIPADGLPRAIAATGDQQWFIVATSEDFRTRLEAYSTTRLSSTTQPRSLGDQPGEFPQLIPSAGASIALATIDQQAYLWKWSADPAEHVPLAQQQNEILALAASPDGTLVAYAGVPGDEEDDGPGLIVVDTQRRYPLAGKQVDSILAAALDPDGQTLATAERISEFDSQGRVILWQVSEPTGAAIVSRTLQYEKQLGDVTALAIAPSGDWLAAGHQSGSATVWNLASTSDAANLPVFSAGRGDRIVAVRFTPDGRWLVAGGRDGQILAIDRARLEMILAACRQVDVTPRQADDPST